MLTIDVLRRAVGGDADELVLTLDRAFQGLPDTAHGGTVLAAFDLVAGITGPRHITGHYLRRVPLGAPLRLRVRPSPTACDLELHADGTTLVTGRIASDASAKLAGAADADRGGLGGSGAGSRSDYFFSERSESAPEPPRPPELQAPGDDAMALPISRACFACGADNPLGLGVQLRADDAAVGGTWTPRPGFGTADGTLAVVAVTTLLDETAFWLGALATGESGMTTELRVTLHAPARAERAVTVAGARASVRRRAGDGRYWDTALAACDADGRLVATAAITFVAVRGAARRLVSGMLAVNPGELLRRVFPAYTPRA